jgi:succinoglycan biosynthesis protein ExoO
LRVGSGLKIKLIEALGQGKALVGTSKTLQGVQNLLASSVRIENTAEGFAVAVATLLGNVAARSELAARGLEVVARHFSAEACYSEFVNEVIFTSSGATSIRDHHAYWTNTKGYKD